MTRAAKILLLVLLSEACGWAQDSVSLVGVGSNLPHPLFDAWTGQFNERSQNIQVRYMPMGTSEGIKQLTHGSGDFAAGEMPLTEAEAKTASGHAVEIPTTLVAIVPIYNLTTVKKDLQFSGEILAKVFVGSIITWNDPAMAKLNPGTNLPAQKISVIHRTEGKGSNYIFTDYLSKVSPAFRAQIGRSASPQWPLGAGANRSEDMMERVKSTPGAIGYVELNYAKKGSVGIGRVQNAAGEFVSASQESIEAAYTATGSSTTAALRVSLANAPGKRSYPITSLTWIYVPISAVPNARSRALAAFLEFVLGEGQNIAQKNGYVPLPAVLNSRAREKLKQLR